MRQACEVGFQISAGNTLPVSLNSSPMVLPPMTMTSPLGMTTLALNVRANAIGAMIVFCGVPLFTSIIMALLVEVLVMPLVMPPATKILPSSNMMPVLYLGYQLAPTPAEVMLPLPAGSTQFICAEIGRASCRERV